MAKKKHSQISPLEFDQEGIDLNFYFDTGHIKIRRILGTTKWSVMVGQTIMFFDRSHYPSKELLFETIYLWVMQHIEKLKGEFADSETAFKTEFCLLPKENRQ